MKFSIKDMKDIVILTLDGGIMGGPDAALLSETLRDLVEEGKKKIVVDMEKVDKMNSSGLGILISGLTSVRNHGGELKLLHLGKKIQELLRITKLHRVFDIFDNEQEAIASFS